MTGIGAATAAGMVLVGCKPGGLPSTTRPGDGALVEMTDLKPDALPGEEAQLVYGGTKVPVTLAQERSGSDLTLRILAHNEPTEMEVYRVGAQEFSISNAAGEVYEPPIDLLRFPLRLGASWDWAGTMTAGGLQKNATARVETSADRLFPETVPLDAVKVAVKLDIVANPPNGPTAKRDLTFWFAEGRGVVRRAFGAASVREPRQEEP
jgi:hypothetical protein